MERQSRLPTHQIDTSSSFMAKAELQKPDGPALEPISIRTDVPPFSHYADIMNPDVPDLTYDCDYDYDFATPHSSSSSHMIPTPVYDWTRPLDEEGMGKKDSYPPLLDDWSPSSVAHYQSSFPSPSHSHYSSPTISRDCALDELNWEKQRYDPLSPTFTTASIAGIGTTTTRISGPYSTSPTFGIDFSDLTHAPTAPETTSTSAFSSYSYHLPRRISFSGRGTTATFKDKALEDQNSRTIQSSIFSNFSNRSTIAATAGL
ncbi:hypothetical protein D9611_005512 [Ephemerocybe angulata]|uniref:Uncharacterized protein n=1 Tax=Ephemerocybe angulata TaxID=980116 RepID=A0A8H5BIC9_9AGAR|nr:hypothetical protein D9611_005512 [Tulosesus angulatus]